MIMLVSTKSTYEKYMKTAIKNVKIIHYDILQQLKTM